jgi:succinate dehydrogenase / fumarate reductase cytochrome b subunit
VQEEVLQTPLFLFYLVGLIAASWHFAYGIWLFSAKWGIVSGDKAQKRFLAVCVVFFFVLSGAGLASLASFRSRPQQPYEPGTSAWQSTQATNNQPAKNLAEKNQAAKNQPVKNTEGR